MPKVNYGFRNKHRRIQDTFQQCVVNRFQDWLSKWAHKNLKTDPSSHREHFCHSEIDWNWKLDSQELQKLTSTIGANLIFNSRESKAQIADSEMCWEQESSFRNWMGLTGTAAISVTRSFSNFSVLDFIWKPKSEAPCPSIMTPV